jgi:POT family proton-dependent oligopeptide transporter
VKPLPATDIAAGEQTWVTLQDVSKLRTGQKIDFDGDTGITVKVDDETAPLNGTFLVGEIDQAGHRVRLLDAIHNKPVASTGTFKAATTTVSTYKLVGPQYFLFFASVAAGAAVVFIFVAGFYRSRTHVRPHDEPVGAVPQ